jgi:Fe-S-cluster containining protein
LDAYAAKACIPLTVVSEAARTEEFGYVCNRCMRCCRNNSIQVNPYESARIARNLNLTTGVFRRRFTARGEGTVLKRRRGGACIFLGEMGCTIHPDRPLVCRLYPLGREVSADAVERFVHLRPHPRSAGVYTREGTIAEFLASGGAAPYLEAADEYSAWLRRALTLLESGASAHHSRPAGGGVDLLEMDTAVKAYCSEKHIPEPRDIEERKAIHLLYLHEALDPKEKQTNDDS